LVIVGDRRFSLVTELLADGVVVPFLRAGANLDDRPENAPWESDSFAPSGIDVFSASGRPAPAAGDPDT
jgi:hypothetical protein